MSDIKYCLSFDCADKTLGICLIGFLPTEEISNRLEIINDETIYKEYYKSKLIHEMLFVKQVWLFNLLPDAKVRETEDYIRLSRLKSALDQIKFHISEMNIVVDEIHIEYQMGQNDLSRLISSAIIYEFCGSDPAIQTVIGPSSKIPTTSTSMTKFISPKISIIMPSGKNSICFNNHLAYSVFAAKYKTNKTANKHHTAENFKYFLKIQNATDLLQDDKKINISANHTEINHIADAFMQSVYKIITTDWAV